MHPHGVAYLKSSEGSPYFDGTMGAPLGGGAWLQASGCGLAFELHLPPRRPRRRRRWRPGHAASDLTRLLECPLLPALPGVGADRADDHVAPGATYTYTWQVPESSGPGPEDPSTLVWMYHSHTSEWWFVVSIAHHISYACTACSARQAA